jgi:hypothetical protein
VAVPVQSATARRQIGRSVPLSANSGVADAGYTRFIEPYQGSPLGVHMHDPSATRPEEVGTMIGKVHLTTGSERHGW